MAKEMTEQEKQAQKLAEQDKQILKLAEQNKALMSKLEGADVGLILQQLMAEKITKEAQKPIEFEPNPNKYVETYWWVQFNGQGESDEKDVFLAVNGTSLTVQREVRVPIPNRFLLMARNATFLNMACVPGKHIVSKGKINTCGFTPLEEATEDDFNKAFKKGNQVKVAAYDAKQARLAAEDVSVNG